MLPRSRKGGASAVLRLRNPTALVTLVSVMARLRPGSSILQTQAAVTAFGAAQERTYPERSVGMSRPANIYPADAAQFRGMPAPLLLVGGLLWASVALVLVIGCVNVMGLLMARAAYRRRGERKRD